MIPVCFTLCLTLTPIVSTNTLIRAELINWSTKFILLSLENIKLLLSNVYYVLRKCIMVVKQIYIEFSMEISIKRSPEPEKWL